MSAGLNGKLRREVCNRCESPRLRKISGSGADRLQVECLDCGLTFTPTGGRIYGTRKTASSRNVSCKAQ
jgi:RNase P subunit RPR2